MTDALLPLLHLCDSLFPIGGFAQSDGLEAATAGGAVANASDLAAWMDVCLEESIGRTEAPALLASWQAFGDRDWDALTAIDAEAIAMRPSSTARAATRGMGLRLAVTWQSVRPDPALAELVARAHRGAIGPALPTAFASACAASSVDQRSALAGFAYTRLAATVSAAMRLMPIGQTDAHRVLAVALARVPAMVDAAITQPARPESYAHALDIAAMSQQYLHSRLFRS